jgi:membrane-associated phospholipid phosphatase
MNYRLARLLPRGPRDFVLQLALWFGFGLVYQIARGITDHDPLRAFLNGVLVIRVEGALHTLIEPDLQRVVTQTGGALLAAVNWTYWLSQFVVLALALLWIYLRHNEVFLRARNWIFATNLLALVGYVLLPTAPPRMFPEDGFVDTLAASSGVNHGSGFVELASNQFAAMPSIHSANALIIGFFMASLVRHRWAKFAWTLWPSWVWFSVIATGNHYWLDVAAGVGVAMLAGTWLAWFENRNSEIPAVVSSPRRW